MIPLAEARRLVLDACPPLPVRAVPIAEAVGCVTASPVVAAEAVPGFDNSAMDGYAVRAADLAGAGVGSPVRLQVLEAVHAGAVAAAAVGPGQAIKIMTGAPMPAGADAVVPVEHSAAARPPGDGRGGEVELSLAVPEGTSVRRAGGDVAAGDEVLPAATLITPAHVGVLASLGATTVDVVPRPRVGVVSTGDELVPPGEPLEVGQIRDSNRPMLLALVAAVAAEPVDLGRIADDEDALEAALRSAAAECDVIVSSGGVSMGDADVVKLVLGRIADMRWMQIAIRPAKPFALGVLDGTPVLGLPGNPVSSLVSFEVLARPGLRRRAGRTDLDRPSVVGVADVDLERSPDGKTHLVRVRTTYYAGRVHVVPVGAQGSNQLAATSAADGLAVLPDGPGVAAGGDTEVLLLDAERTLAAAIRPPPP